jgi:hypothetical protein
MKRIAIKSNPNGSFELVPIELKYENVCECFRPELKSIGGCPQCKVTGNYYDSGGFLAQDDVCFIWHHLDLGQKHRESCQAPVHRYSHILDRLYDCGEEINHRGPIFFLKSKNSFFESEPDSELEESAEDSYGYAVKHCEWLDCTESDIEIVAKRIRRICRLPEETIENFNLVSLCAIL